MGNPYPYPRILHQQKLYPYPYGYGRYITRTHGSSTRGYGLTRGYIRTPWERSIPTGVTLAPFSPSPPLPPVSAAPPLHRLSRRPHSPSNATRRNRRAVTAGRAGTHQVSPLPARSPLPPPPPPPNGGPRSTARAPSSYGPPGRDWVDAIHLRIHEACPNDDDDINVNNVNNPQIGRAHV